MGEMGLDGVTVQREPGGDLLSRVLRRSTLGAGGFHGRVRDGIGWVRRRCGHQASAGRMSWFCRWDGDLLLRVAGASWALRPGGRRVGEVCIEHVRAISTAWLHALLRDHLRPIDVMVSHGSRGALVSRRVSRLDAFSGYPVRT